jgi:uncharacterized protein
MQEVNRLLTLALFCTAAWTVTACGGPAGAAVPDLDDGTQDHSTTPPPIIDMHLHAVPAASQGPPPLAFCLPVTSLPAGEPGRAWMDVFMEWQKSPPCADPLWSAATDDELMRRTLEILERRNITGVTSGPLLDAYRQAGAERIIPALLFGDGALPPLDSLRTWFEQGRYRVLGEVVLQYQGITADDTAFAPYLALAEELDVPVGIHIGTGPPGTPYLGFANYRAHMHSPLQLEEVLLRHPRLRLYIMHAGWPMIDDLLALMWTHPQVYVDVGVISFALPRPAFHSYLQRIVEAGFHNRVLFGSDQMIWPETIDFAIESIETAPFLSEGQKRDILYHNAVRFLRLEVEARAGG